MVTFFLAIYGCLCVPVALWFRNRRIAGQVILALQPFPQFTGVILAFSGMLIVPIVYPLRPPSLILAVILTFPLFVVGTVLTVFPWRFTKRGILSSSGFMTWERIESVWWWGEDRLTVYPKRGSSRFASVTTIVPVAQQGAVEALLREHTHIGASGTLRDDRRILPRRGAIVIAAVYVGIGIAGLTQAGMAQTDIMFGLAAGFMLDAFPARTRARRIARWVGGLVIAAVALHQLWLFLS